MTALKTYLLPLLTFLALGACTSENDPEPIVLPEAVTSVIDASGNTYEVGYRQTTNTNQDAWVKKTAPDGTLTWQTIHAAAPGVDEKAILVTLDPDNRPWVVFTLDGGSYSDDYITRKETMPAAFDSVFISTYGKGGGAAVSVVCRLDSATGAIEKGTFLMSRTGEGNVQAVDKTNSLKVTMIGAGREKVVVHAQSWYLPPAVEATQSNYVHHPDATAENKTDNHWEMVFELPPDLSSLTKSEVVPPIGN